MRSLPRTPSRSAMAAGLLVLAAAIGTSVALATESTTPLAITGFTVHGDQVRIGVVNRGVETRTAILAVRVRGQNGETETRVPVTVAGGRKAFVEVCMPSWIEPPAEVSIILDDGSPF